MPGPTSTASLLAGGQQGGVAGLMQALTAQPTLAAFQAVYGPDIAAHQPHGGHDRGGVEGAAAVQAAFAATRGMGSIHPSPAPPRGTTIRFERPAAPGEAGIGAQQGLGQASQAASGLTVTVRLPEPVLFERLQ